MLNVTEGVTAGHDLTRCAVDAGFATLSHFSETFHRMFGLSATTLLATGVRFDVPKLCDEFRRAPSSYVGPR
ncbi:helix-turn-helix domain-containing protein [Nocardia sp. NBC_01499]